jgi:hypothetical protein
MQPPRLPIPAAPAQHETVASYLARLANLHGLPLQELWKTVSTPRPGSGRRDVLPDRLAALTGRPAGHLAYALPELHPALDWTAWRHQPQPGCPRCDARHDGGPVQRLLPHHYYVCARHRYWIGPPDVGQPATPLTHPVLRDVLRAQRRHLRLLHQHGPAAAFDAVLTGYLICGHAWADPAEDWHPLTRRFDHRTHTLIPAGHESSEFSASRIFAAAYPEAVHLAELIAAPAWRHLAAGKPQQQQRFLDAIAPRLGRPDYQPPHHGDAVAHWMIYDSNRPPSRPQTTYPQTLAYGATRPARTSESVLDRQARSAHWFANNRLGGSTILHHRHTRPVLIREWSRPMDGMAATIAESRSTRARPTLHLWDAASLPEGEDFGQPNKPSNADQYRYDRASYAEDSLSDKVGA